MGRYGRGDYPAKAQERLTSAGNWTGGAYELAIEIGPNDDVRLERALAALGPAVGVADWYGTSGLEPHQPQPVPASLASLNQHGSLKGIVQLPDGEPIVCDVGVVREDDGSDWLDFGIPIAALEHAYPGVVSFPFVDNGEASWAWSKPIDTWLAGVAERLYADIDFQLGLIGYPASGGDSAAGIRAEGVPQKRVYGYLIPDDGNVVYLSSTG